MIKDSAYIREFTPKHRQLLEALQASTGIKTANGLLLHALEKCVEQCADIARLERIITYKQNKIERLENKEQCHQ